MVTFLGGLAILIIGGFLYSILVEKVFGVKKDPTPAYTMQDGVDYVPMSKFKNGLIHLLNIAGTGPILGPIQGVLFGPIAFISIPIGCIIGGIVHDYMCGMISVRNSGEQTPTLIKRYLGKGFGTVVSIFTCFLLLLCGAVFIYTPADMITVGLLNSSSEPTNPLVWIIYGIIIAYYLAATIFPIDKIIGKIYPIFGGILILSAIGIFIFMFIKGYPLTEIWETGLISTHPDKLKFIPIFFVTVACGIVSGFHSTQSSIISRTVSDEKHGRGVFSYMMVLEGVIAMIWAAAAMGIFNLSYADSSTPATNIVGIVAKDLLGNIGGIVAILGVVVLAITSGDTVIRSIRLILSEAFHIPQEKSRTRVLLCLAIVPFIIGLLVMAKLDSEGFAKLWRYFAWGNQTVATVNFLMISIYLVKNKRCWLISLVPGTFYSFITTSFICNAKIGLNLNWTISYIIGAVFALAFAAVVLIAVAKNKKGQLCKN